MKYTIKSIRKGVEDIWGVVYHEDIRDQVLASLRETPSVERAWAEDEDGNVIGEETKFFMVPSGAQVPITEAGFITTDVVLDVNTLIDHDFEGFLDLLSCGATDTEILTEIEYQVTALTPDGNLVFSVTGNVSMILEMEEDRG